MTKGDIIKPYYEEPDIKIYCGHTLETLRTLGDESVNTIITSPPYWGLRDYGEDTKTIWDGDPSCEHQWRRSQTEHDALRYRGQNSIISNNSNPEIYKGKELSSGDFCSKCGAWHGQLGLESTLDLYISHLLQVTAELKRVLRKDGVIFWNQGDSYGGVKTGNTNASTGAIGKPRYAGPETMTFTKQAKGYEKCLLLQNFRLILRMVDEQGWILRNRIIWHKKNHMPSSVKDRFSNAYEPVFMLVKNDDPVYFYNVKTGLMADRKAKDPKENIDWEWRPCPRCQKDFLAVAPDGKSTYWKSPVLGPCSRCKGTGKIKYSFWRALDYWFDLDAVRLPHKDTQDYERHAPFNYRVREAKKGHTGIIGVKSTEQEMLRYDKKGQPRGPEYKGKWKDNQKYLNKLQQRINDARAKGIPHDLAICDPKGKNPGDVWTIPTQPFPEAHFATFPEKLVSPMILAGCPQWVCKKCGKARVRITSKEYTTSEGQPPPFTKQQGKKFQGKVKGEKKFATRYEVINKTEGWTDCGCGAGWDLGVLLDPFTGAGTAGVVAKKLNRGFIGIDIKEEYCTMAANRIKNITPSLALE